MSPSRRLVAVLSCVIALGAAATVASARTPAAVLKDRSATGLQLMTAYSTLLVAKDVPALRGMLAPSFLVQRTDGSWADRRSFLGRLPDLRSFTFTKAVQRRHGRFLAVRLETTSTLMVNGQEYAAGPAPLLGSWHWDGTSWWLLAQGNFNVPKG